MIRLELVQRPDGGILVTSEDVKGLSITGRDPAETMARVWEALVVLKLRGEEVGIHLDLNKGPLWCRRCDDLPALRDGLCGPCYLYVNKSVKSVKAQIKGSCTRKDCGKKFVGRPGKLFCSRKCAHESWRKNK